MFMKTGRMKWVTLLFFYFWNAFSSNCSLDEYYRIRERILARKALHVLTSENLKHTGFKLFTVLTKYSITLSKQPF